MKTSKVMRYGSLFLCTLLVLFTSASPSMKLVRANAFSVTIDIENNDLLSKALDAYFAGREKEFALDRRGETLDSSHVDYLENWLSTFSYSVTSSSATYRVEELLEEKEETYKIKVYEWVYLYYSWSYENTVSDDVLGFGTHHVLTINRSDCSVLNDSYIEINGYQHYREEDYPYIRIEEDHLAIEKSSVLPENQETIAQLITVPDSTRSLSASAAVAYADQWCGQSTPGSIGNVPNINGYNPEFYYYLNDCCNFVSQCLYAAGVTMNSVHNANTWWTTPLPGSTTHQYDVSSHSGLPWICVSDFDYYFSGLGYPILSVNNTSKCRNGNPIYWLNSSGSTSGHAMLIVGKQGTGTVLVDAHNHDAYRYPISISQYTLYTIDFYHSNVVSTYSLYQHKYTCGFCGMIQYENHTWVAYPSYYKCLVCGQTTTSLPSPN